MSQQPTQQQMQQQVPSQQPVQQQQQQQQLPAQQKQDSQISVPLINVWTVFTLIFYAILFAPLYFYRQELLLNTPILPVQKSEMDVVNSTPPTEAPLQGVASETPAQMPTNVQNSIPIN
ncbi:hypothetical protein HDU92_006392 [Lobulomyces angularis]|nr:hypothetical protein HDU92_006392 [Lobulomyces angularis]